MHGFCPDSGSEAMRYVATDAYESKRREKAWRELGKSL